jgi:hypothetical protein
VDDQIWKECALLIQTKAHLTTEGLIKIVTLKSALNKGLPDRLVYTPRFLDRTCNVQKRKLLSLRPLLWLDLSTFQVIALLILIGFLGLQNPGDGCFSCSILKKYPRAVVVYQITAHERELPLLYKVQYFFDGSGSVLHYPKLSAAFYSVSKQAQLIHLIVPHFTQHISSRIFLFGVKE